MQRNGQPVPPHWLRPNEESRSPHRVIFLDTETRPEMAGTTELHRLRWWHARHCRRHTDRPRLPTSADYAGTDADALADVIDRLALARYTTWIYAHNLGFDLTVTQLAERMTACGWRLDEMGITGRSPWLRMSCGRRRLVMADSHSWLPAGLLDVGRGVGIAKPAVESWTDASDEEIAVRCLADVVILAEAMLSVMDWWDDHDCGRWSWTGPGCGWAMYRHKYLTHKVLMDPAGERTAMERRALYGGRREAWRIGRQGDGHYADLDFQSAYPFIAANYLLPRRPVSHVPDMTLDAYKSLPADWGILAEVKVTTKTPVVPVRHNGTVLYPVGTFITTLCSPDIDAALKAGATITIGETYVYQLAPIMKEWGTWITGVLTGDGETVPPAVAMWLKHMSRTTIGRWALRAQRTEDWGDAAHIGFYAETGHDLDTGAEMIDVHACGRHLRIIRDQEPENVFPAVTAWVEAHCRQLLAAAVAECPPGSVLQCDTDGFIVALEPPQTAASSPATPAPAAAPGSLAATSSAPPVPEFAGPCRVRVKALFRDVAILGPQQVVMGDQRRLAGIPRGFVTDDGLAYSGWTWPSWTWQLGRDQPGIYVRPHVTVGIRGPYGSRWVSKDGTTITPEMVTVRRRNKLLIPGEKRSRIRAEMLADNQPATLLKAAA